MDNSVYLTDTVETEETKTRTATRRMRYKTGKRTYTAKSIKVNHTMVTETDNVVNFSDTYLSTRDAAVLPAYASVSGEAAIEVLLPAVETTTLAPIAPKAETSVECKKKPLYAFTKRLFDIVSSGLAIILLSPVMLVLALLVKMTSKGPVFYVSDRVGKNGKTFKFLKFRSMCTDADKQLDELLEQNEAEGGVIFKMKDDPRITKFGKFIRKTSLDELPQLFNIFIGDMAVVGPRPCTTREYALYSDRDKQRLLVKQGLTCIWQCSGRSNTTFDEQIEMDVKYIKRRGFFYDLWLILKTCVAVFKHDGAL